MSLRRRSILYALSATALIRSTSAARADAADLAVSCDTTLGPALRAAARSYAAETGVHITVFPTASGLILPQLQRQVRIDVVITQPAALDQAVQAAILTPSVRAGPWRDRLVIAGLRGAVFAPDGPVAASDPTPGSELDGAAVLDRLGLRTASMLGAIDTDGVAFLVATGAAPAGLLHMTDVRANPRLDVIRPVPDEVQPPVVFAAGCTKPPPDPAAAFVAFLATPKATAILTASGLETAE